MALGKDADELSATSANPSALFLVSHSSTDSTFQARLTRPRRVRIVNHECVCELWSPGTERPGRDCDSDTAMVRCTKLFCPLNNFLGPDCDQ